jgi:hypothetical protein
MGGGEREGVGGKGAKLPTHKGLAERQEYLPSQYIDLEFNQKKEKRKEKDKVGTVIVKPVGRKIRYQNRESSTFCGG